MYDLYAGVKDIRLDEYVNNLSTYIPVNHIIKYRCVTFILQVDRKSAKEHNKE